MTHIIAKFFHEFIDEDFQQQFIDDIKYGNYREWLRRYPQCNYGIFESFITYAETISETDIDYFKQMGVDLNNSSNIYNNNFCIYRTEYGSTPLTSSCEFIDTKLVEILIKQGADVNLKDKYGYTPLDALVILSDTDESKRVEKEECKKIIVEAGGKLSSNTLETFYTDLLDFTEEH